MRYVDPLHLTAPVRSGVALLALAWLAGCVSYHAKPLSSAEPAPDSASKLVVDAASMPLPRLREHRFDPSDGLDATEVAMLAVANNPDLRLSRDDLGIQRAQAFAAGLLPDPQLSFGRDYPISPAPDLVTATTTGITQDISALLLRSSTARATRLDTRKIGLDQLWAEWQTVAQSRVLFDQTRSDEKLLGGLRQLLPDYDRLQQSIHSALSAGNLSADVAAGPLLAAADLKRQIADVAQRLNQEWHSLRLLLGLNEHAQLRLVDDPTVTEDESIVPADIDQRLAALPERRPDLLALRRGYEAQESRLRLAVLKQFPAITLGFNYATDTSNITTRGFSVGLSLPLFDRGRGPIAVESATRQRLFDEYQARLATTRSDVDRIRTDLPNIARQLQEAERDAQQLTRGQQAAAQAFAAGMLDWNAYLTLSTSAVTKRIESVQLALTLKEQEGALRTLLGSELPSAAALSESH
jgi:outer membrane protein, heavy metal efflux system